MRELSFIMVAVLLASLCLSCDPEGGTDGKLPDYTYTKADYRLELGRIAKLKEDTEWSIIDSYYQKLQSSGKNGKLTINDIWIEKYFGAYCPPYIAQEQYDNGKTWEEIYQATENQTVFAVLMGVKGRNNSTEVNITHAWGRAFVRDGNRIFLWHDGQLYDLEEHYDRSNRSGGGLLFRWDFLGIANLQNGLEPEAQITIEEDYGKTITWLPRHYYQIGLQYLGTYNGYIVLKTNQGLLSNKGLSINGVWFYMASDDRIFAWKEGEIFELPDLHKQGLITGKDLVTAAYNLNGYHDR